jgi:hypothetical protein
MRFILPILRRPSLGTPRGQDGDSSESNVLRGGGANRLALTKDTRHRAKVTLVMERDVWVHVTS